MQRLEFVMTYEASTITKRVVYIQAESGRQILDAIIASGATLPILGTTSTCMEGPASDPKSAMWWGANGAHYWAEVGAGSLGADVQRYIDRPAAYWPGA